MVVFYILCVKISECDVIKLHSESYIPQLYVVYELQ